MSTSNTPHDPYAALRIQDFRLLLIGNFITSLGGQMLTFALGWELWLRTNDEIFLGLIGLAQVIPVVLFSLPAGHIADRYNRRRIVKIAQAAFAFFALSLGALSYFQGPIWLIYTCLFGMGLAHAFNSPAASTLMPEAVPQEHFTNAATWSSSAWQLASVVGPALGGLVLATTKSTLPHYLFYGFAALLFVILLNLIKGRPLARSQESATLKSLLEGLRFIWNTKVILAAITLDMFSVLIGGAVALLPVYATDILKVGEIELGIMAAAPSTGAILVAFILAHRPPFKNAGWALLLSVAGFGLATIIFGISTNLWLSVAMLALLGGLDNISVVIRQTLFLTYTPDEIRGRASAVNSIFISLSNELGGFESGLVASLFGPIIAVVGGGLGTLLVVGAVAQAWPELRSLKTLHAPQTEETPA